MKGFLRASLAFILAFAVAGFANAGSNHEMNKNMKNKLWMCETNASSSSVDADVKADDKMKKGMKSGKEAFDFAMKHCRDCTKITCTMEENANADQTNNNDKKMD